MRAVASVLLLAGSVSAQSYCGNSYTGCRPAGERMYTAYPNSPVIGKEFNLLIVGCNMPSTGMGNSVDRDYVIVPDYRSCSSVNTDALPGECKMNVDTLDTTKVIPPACKESGWLCTNCAKMAHNDGTFMSTTAISKIIYGEGSTGAADGEMVPLTVCRQSIAYNAAGNRTVEWTALPTHDREVSRRADFLALSEGMVVRGAAAIGGAPPMPEEGDSCCEGLKLGDWCLPLIVFILLWLLMAGLLALLAYMCHKNQRDMEAERNNLQFSNFGEGNELADLKDADADEDDI